jgi:ABC-type Mn2+/Zn2+ transport system permease subunit
MINFNDFLIFAAIIALLSIIVGVFLGYHAEKQLKEYKKRAGQK